MVHDHVVFVAVRDPEMIEQVIKNLYQTKYQVMLGDKVNCFSELVNNCIKACKTAYFIFCSHKTSPTDADVERMVDLLSQGYGLVGLQRFAFFGIRMDVIEKIGNFDESFPKGWYEDIDYKIRLQYNNIAFYEDACVEYRPAASTWADKDTIPLSYNTFINKYNIDKNTKTIYIQKMSECDKLTNDTSLLLPFDKTVQLKEGNWEIYYELKLDTFKCIFDKSIDFK